MMRILILMCVLAATALGSHKPNLKVRFDIKFWDGFIELPKSNTSANASGWVQKTRPVGPTGLASLEMWCPVDDYSVCVFCDDTGYIAGTQIAFDKELVSNAMFDWAVLGFTNWTTTMDGTSKEYFTTQQYYISSETLAKDPATRIAARNKDLLLQDGYLWVSGINGDLYKISTDVNDITGPDSVFIKQRCIPGMGQHYFRNLTTSTECIDENMFPWFIYVDDGQLIGLGLNIFTQYNIKKGSTNWFEYSGEIAMRLTLPNGPECLYEMGRNGGQVSLHTYFIDNPWKATCLSLG